MLAPHDLEEGLVLLLACLQNNRIDGISFACVMRDANCYVIDSFPYQSKALTNNVIYFSYMSGCNTINNT